MESTKQVIKLAEEELTQLKQLEQRNVTLNNEIIRVNLLKLNLKQAEESIEAYYKENIQLETQIAKSLQDKYGQGKIDIGTGEFIPSGIE